MAQINEITENNTKMISKIQKIGSIDFTTNKIGQNFDFIYIKLFLNEQAAVIHKNYGSI